jgi:ribosome recycling factor
MPSQLIADLKRRMEGAVASLQHELSGLRAGRASPALLDSVVVEAYGSKMPISQVGTVSVPEARMLSVHVWDGGMVKTVEKAISNAGLGLNPSSDGQYIRVPLPELSEERRKEMVKVAGKYTETAKIAIRNIRRDGMDGLKKMEKDAHVSEDEHRQRADEIQKLTDQYVKKMDEMLATKEKDILHV